MAQKDQLLGLKSGARKERDQLIKRERQRIKALSKKSRLDSLLAKKDQPEDHKRQKIEESESGANADTTEEKSGVKDRSHLYD